MYKAKSLVPALQGFQSSIILKPLSPNRENSSLYQPLEESYVLKFAFQKLQGPPCFAAVKIKVQFFHQSSLVSPQSPTVPEQCQDKANNSIA